MFQKLRMLYNTENLAEEGDGLLIELLRVSDVGRDDLLERQIRTGTLGELSPVLLRLDGQLTAHSVLRRFDVLIDVLIV